MIRVVLWDIDGTLLDFAAAEQAAIRACFALHGLGECTDEMLQEYAVINRRYWERLERGELTKQEVLVERFREFFGNHGLPQDIVETFNDSYQPALGETVCFHEGALETVTALKGRVRQYAVTNGTKIAQRRKLKKSGLDQLFDGIFISEDLGAEKPSIAFFEAVWQEIGRYPGEEVLIVGDSLTSDMQGGINAGLRTCWYHPDGTDAVPDRPVNHVIRRLPEVLDLV